MRLTVSDCVVDFSIESLAVALLGLGYFTVR